MPFEDTCSGDILNLGALYSKGIILEFRSEHTWIDFGEDLNFFKVPIYCNQWKYKILKWALVTNKNNHYILDTIVTLNSQIIF